MLAVPLLKWGHWRLQSRSDLCFNWIILAAVLEMV